MCVPANLPDGSTVEGLYQSRMQELAESVLDLGESSSVLFDWDMGDMGICSQPGSMPAESEDGGGPVEAGNGTPPAGGGGEGGSTRRSGDVSMSPSSSPVFM